MGKEMGRVRVRVAQLSVELDYIVGSRNGPKAISYTVHLTFTSCNYGGHRPWFVCPKCGRRVSKLYQNGELFLCRHCHKLAYACQSEDSLLRLMRKAKRIRERLDCSRNLTEPILFKPKGMHQRTFDWLRLQEMTIMSRFYSSANTEMESLRVRSVEAMAILDGLVKARE